MRNPVIATLAALVLAGCGNGKVIPEPVRPVLTQVVVPGAGATKDVYSGELRARYETELGFRVAGKLVSRAVDAGARVQRGQVLARLDPEDAKLAAQAAGAQLASAESEFALAKSELARIVFPDLIFGMYSREEIEAGFGDIPRDPNEMIGDILSDEEAAAERAQTAAPSVVQSRSATTPPRRTR